MMVSLEFLGKNKILLLKNFFLNAQVSTSSSLKWTHEMQYHVPTVTKGTVSSPLWNPLWLRVTCLVRAGRAAISFGPARRLSRILKRAERWYEAKQQIIQPIKLIIKEYFHKVSRVLEPRKGCYGEVKETSCHAAKIRVSKKPIFDHGKP